MTLKETTGTVRSKSLGIPLRSASFVGQFQRHTYNIYACLYN